MYCVWCGMRSQATICYKPPGPPEAPLYAKKTNHELIDLITHETESLFICACTFHRKMLLISACSAVVYYLVGTLFVSWDCGPAWLSSSCSQRDGLFVVSGRFRFDRGRCNDPNSPTS